MAIKRVLVPERVRRVPRQFGWIDRRLLREGYLQGCDASALALYLFLVTVADAQGLSFYADATLERSLSILRGDLVQARGDLIRAGLIAYQAPLYQVLSLDPPPSSGMTGVKSLGTTLEHLQRQWQDKRTKTQWRPTIGHHAVHRRSFHPTASPGSPE